MMRRAALVPLAFAAAAALRCGSTGPGTVVVSGTGADSYYVADSLGARALTGSRPTNKATELLPGTYGVQLRDRSFTVQVRPGDSSVVRP